MAGRSLLPENGNGTTYLRKSETSAVSLFNHTTDTYYNEEFGLAILTYQLQLLFNCLFLVSFLGGKRRHKNGLY